MDVEPFVALQPHAFGRVQLGQDLGHLGFARAGLAFEEQWAAQIVHQHQGRRERAVSDITQLPQAPLQVDDGVHSVHRGLRRPCAGRGRGTSRG